MFDRFLGHEFTQDGRVAVTAELYDPARGAARSGVWGGGFDAVELIAQTGDDASLGGGQEFVDFGLVRASNAGDVLFTATHDGPSDSASGVWLANGGSMQRLVGEGDSAPGVPGAVFDDLFESGIELGGAGDAFVSATLRAGEEGEDVDHAGGIWSIRDGVIASEPLALLGGEAPGTDGARFDLFSNVNNFTTASNDRSQYVLQATLIDGENGVINNENDEGLWAYDPSFDELKLIARTGELYDVFGDGSDWRTISAIEYNPVYGFADNGWLAFTLLFEEGSDFFGGSSAAYRVQVPTPGAAALLGLASFGVVRRRR